MKESVAVWLIVTDGKNQGKILLQQRAETEVENGKIKKQSYPYVCQPTWNGKVKPGEDLMQAIKREAEEELGKDFVKNYNFKRLIPFNSRKYRTKGEEVIGYNFVGLITESELKSVKLHQGALPKFVFISSLDFWERVKPLSEKTDPRSEIVLFGDQWKALENIYQLKKILLPLT